MLSSIGDAVKKGIDAAKGATPSEDENPNENPQESTPENHPGNGETGEGENETPEGDTGRDSLELPDKEGRTRWEEKVALYLDTMWDSPSVPFTAKVGEGSGDMILIGGGLYIGYFQREQKIGYLCVTDPRNQNNLTIPICNMGRNKVYKEGRDLLIEIVEAMLGL